MNTTTKVTLGAGVVILGVGLVAWMHSRNVEMQGTQKDAAATAAQAAATSAGKTSGVTVQNPAAVTNGKNPALLSKMQANISDVQSAFAMGMNAVNAARAVAASPSK